MGLLSRKSADRIDEARLLAEPPDPEIEVPPRLLRAEVAPWTGTRQQVDQILDALGVYRKHRIRLRTSQAGPSMYRVDIASSIDSLPYRMVLVGADGRAQNLPTEAVLDANILFCRFARIEDRWRARAAHEWSDWDLAVAWAAETHDAHGGQFDLPASSRSPSEQGLPLFGWRLDLAAGVATRHDVAVVRFKHPVHTAGRLVPLFDVQHCFRRGQTAAERIRSRPVYLPHGGGQGWIRTISLTDRAVVVDPIREDTDVCGALEVGVTELLEANPDLPELIEQLADHELTELRRRLEAHAAAQGFWVAPVAMRVELGRSTMPLTGWQLADDAFHALAQGEVRFVHRVESRPLAVSARQAVHMMRREVPPSDRLFGDPCVHPERPDVPHFVRAIDPSGIVLTHGPDIAADHGDRITHSAWILANPDLVDALVSCVPDLGIQSSDPDLRTALAELPDNISLGAWRRSITVPLAVTSSPAAARLAGELLERGAVHVPSHWRDIDGHVWQWVGMQGDRFVFALDPSQSTLRALPGPEHDTWDGLLLSVDEEEARARLLTPSQLSFASPMLCRFVAAWQVASGVVSEDGTLMTVGQRMNRLLDVACQELDELTERTVRHLAISATLQEDSHKSRVTTQYIERLQANRDDLASGHGAYLWLNEDSVPMIGAGLSAGGAASAHRRACDDRLRVSERIQSHFLGQFRFAMVGSGDAFRAAPGGPLVSRLLDDIEDRMAAALFDAMDTQEAQQRCLNAVVEASEAASQASPFCSFASLITRLDTGESWVIWCGNSRVWRFRRAERELRSLTQDASFEGLTKLGQSVGLSAEDALQAMLLFNSSVRTRRDLESATDAQLIQRAERLQSPGRRRAIRAALGGDTAQDDKQRRRVLELFRLFEGAYPHRLDLSVVENGRGMVFLRPVMIRPDDRLVLATDGLSVLAEHQPLWVQRALSQADPQRAVEWLTEGLSALDGHADDLGVVVIDPSPTAKRPPEYMRVQEQLYRFTDNVSVLESGGVVMGVPASGYHALRLTPRRLGRFAAELDEALKRRRVTRSGGDPLAVAAAIASWASGRRGRRDRPKRWNQVLRNLHDVIDEQSGDPLVATLLTLTMLHRAGLEARYVTGIRLKGVGDQQVTEDTCWLEFCHDGEDWVLDPTQVDHVGIMRRGQAYDGAKIVRTRMLGMGRRKEPLAYVPDATTQVAVVTEGAPAQRDPWLQRRRLKADGGPDARPPSAVRPSRPQAPESATTPPPVAAPNEPEPSQTTADGFLDLDF